MALFNLAHDLELHHLSALPKRQSPHNWYTLESKALSESGYLLYAIPRNAQAKGDLACQTLTLDHTGKQGITRGPSGEPRSTAVSCWQ